MTYRKAASFKLGEYNLLPGIYDILIHILWKIQFWKKFCYLIPIQTLSFLTALPTHQGGVKSHDKASFRQKCEKLEKLTERLLSNLHSSNLVNTIFYFVF